MQASGIKRLIFTLTVKRTFLLRENDDCINCATCDIIRGMIKSAFKYVRMTRCSWLLCFASFSLSSCLCSHTKSENELIASIRVNESPIELPIGDNLANYIERQRENGSRLNHSKYPMSFTPNTVCFVIDGEKYYWHGDAYMQETGIAEPFILDEKLFDIRTSGNSKRYPVINQYMKPVYWEDRAKEKDVGREELLKELTFLLHELNSKLRL